MDEIGNQALACRFDNHYTELLNNDAENALLNCLLEVCSITLRAEWPTAMEQLCLSVCLLIVNAFFMFAQLDLKLCFDCWANSFDYLLVF
jgi:hypothetical protein